MVPVWADVRVEMSRIAAIEDINEDGMVSCRRTMML
jgi:hypothetical protein